MKKLIRLLLILTMGLVSAQTFSQDLIRAGLVRTQLTISPSYLFSEKQSYFYLHGNLEAYLDKKLSIAGEGYYFLGSLSANKNIFSFNHNLFLGASYHFVKKNNDFYLGLQSGISITKLNAQENNLAQSLTGINPLFSSVIGYNLYVHKRLHFFVQPRFVFGEHNFDLHKNLTEFRFSAGLGFNF